MRPPVRRFATHIVPLLAYLALIFWLSSRSNLPPLGFFPGMDKVIHFGEYAVLAVLLTRALAGNGMSFRRAALWAALGCALYGASDEYHQKFVPRRDASVKDWAADVLGATTAAWGWLAYRRSL